MDDRFELLEPLIEQPHGSLWHAELRKTRRRVIVARCKKDAPEDVVAAMELAGRLTEVRAFALANVLASGRDGAGLPFLVTESVGEVTLRDVIHRGPALTLEAAIGLISDVLDGLGAAHRAGCAHGDLEPGHIRLARRSVAASPKIVAFGINRMRVRAGRDRPSDDDALESLAYLAPEQASGEVLAGPRADLYSVAAIAYTLLTGRLPHSGATYDELRDRAATADVPPLAEVRPELPSALCQAIDRGLRRAPEERFADAGAFRSALRQALLRAREARRLETRVGVPAGESHPPLAQLDEETTTMTPAPISSAGEASPRGDAVVLDSAGAGLAPFAAGRSEPPGRFGDEDGQRPSSTRSVIPPSRSSRSTDLELIKPAETDGEAPQWDDHDGSSDDGPTMSSELPARLASLVGRRPSDPPLVVDSEIFSGVSTEDESVETVSALPQQLATRQADAPPSPAPNRGLRWKLAFVGVSVAAGLGIGLALTTPSSSVGPAEADAGEAPTAAAPSGEGSTAGASGPGDGLGVDEAAEGAETTPPARPGGATLTLRGLPANAEIEITSAEGTAYITLPPSDEPRRIRVRAPGHRPFTTEVDGANDSDVTVEMDALTARQRRLRRVRAQRRRAARRRRAR